MLRKKQGDLFKSGCKILCHQVNCQGVMGSGIALIIRKMYPKVYKEYMKYTRGKTPEELLGKVLFVEVDGIIIANIFGQLDYGVGKLQTDYDALEAGMREVREKSKQLGGCRVGMPCKMGCDRAGGDWVKVEKKMTELYEGEGVYLEIWEKID